jgi:hypothetical protein
MISTIPSSCVMNVTVDVRHIVATMWALAVAGSPPNAKAMSDDREE